MTGLSFEKFMEIAVSVAVEEITLHVVQGLDKVVIPMALDEKFVESEYKYFMSNTMKTLPLKVYKRCFLSVAAEVPDHVIASIVTKKYEQFSNEVVEDLAKIDELIGRPPATPEYKAQAKKEVVEEIEKIINVKSIKKDWIKNTEIVQDENEEATPKQERILNKISVALKVLFDDAKCKTIVEETIHVIESLDDDLL